MKAFKIFAMAAAALVMGLTSCNKENVETTETSLKQVEVRIKTGSTRAAGVDEAGLGKENDIADGWYAFAKNSADNDYSCVQSTGSGAAAKAAFTSVPVGSDIYVIANPSTAMNTALTAMAGQTNITLTQIKGLIQSVVKADLSANNDQLQAAPAAPQVSPMLMTGTAKVTNTADPSDATKVKVTVSLEREYAKVNMTVTNPANHVVNHPVNVGESITIESIDQINVHRVVNRINPFNLFHGATAADLTGNAEWFIKKSPSYVGDVSANNGTPAVGSSDIVFKYAPATGQKQSFYVTPNYAGINAYATAVIIKATVSGTWDGLTYASKDRYYRAFVYDKDIAAEKGITLRNTIYNISGTITGIGEGTEGEALDKDNVDLNVYVDVKKWAVRAFAVDME